MNLLLDERLSSIGGSSLHLQKLNLLRHKYKFEREKSFQLLILHNWVDLFWCNFNFNISRQGHCLKQKEEHSVEGRSH